MKRQKPVTLKPYERYGEDARTRPTKRQPLHIKLGTIPMGVMYLPLEEWEALKARYENDEPVIGCYINLFDDKTLGATPRHVKIDEVRDLGDYDMYFVSG